MESAEIVGHPVLAGGDLSTFDGQLKLTVSIHDDPGAHPSLAHCHVLAEIADRVSQLDACTLGISPERQEALVQAGQNWIDLAGGPIFSLFHAAPVLQCEHFDGTEAWGVDGCHGFAGPLCARFLQGETDLNMLANAACFD